MKIQGEHVFATPRPQVWEALMDPEVLARTIPGCKGLEAVGENRFQGALDIKVGPVQGRFQGTVDLSEIEPPEAYRLRLKGRGAQGFVDGDGQIRLADADDGGTVMHYEIDAKVGGRIASVGQRLLDSSARVITRQALEGLERQLPTAPEAAAGGEPSARPPAAAPSQVEFAGRFARGLLAEMVPPEKRPLVGAVVLGVGLIGALLLVRGCGGG